MKYVDADKIAVALGKMPTWPDFDVRGEIGYTPYCVCCCSTDECEDNVSDRLLREAEAIYEKEVKKEEETMRTAIPTTVGVVQRKNTTVVNWDDGVKTVVTLKPDDCPDEMFVGFCIAYRTGLEKVVVGEAHHNHKLTDKDIRYIRNSTESSYKIAKELNVDSSTVRDIRNGRTWRHVK